MRVHRLRITAFGPFAATVEVDLDALAAGGLFLLHGPTGAGKTSLLDAVCFALYGSVPGSRQGARLRSDHAADGVPPQVVCEITAAGRRLEVTRSPAWDRPKKRGTGTTLEQARVLVRELRDGEWVPVTSRVDEAAEVLADVLGLGVDQFTKLVLLPQGEFAAFLRANAEDRRALLERLFGTDRFAAAQQWLREAQAARRQEVEAADARTAELLARAEQATAMIGSIAGAAAATGATTDTPPDQAVDPIDRLRALRTGVDAALDEARQLRVAAQARARHAAAEHQAAVETARRQARFAELTRAAERLRAEAPEQARREARLANARRAAGVARWLRPLELARTRSGDALGAVDRAIVDLARHGTAEDVGLDDERLQARALDARQLVGELVALELEGAEAPALEREVTVARSEVARAERHRTTGARTLDALADERERLAADLVDARAAAAALPGALAALDQAEAVAAAAERTRTLTSESVILATRRDELRRARDDARERRLDLRERRLAGMAAELALGLRAGSPCPVCGAVDHPAPAPTAADGPDEAAETRA
ncbi:MAG TPA: SMC family ATPase, partial [Kineosporiaceae bacterium]|nr:SMC family ATPase [Kineosporiaceae bacterium]